MQSKGVNKVICVLLITLSAFSLSTLSQTAKPLRETTGVSGETGIIKVKGRTYYVQQSIGQNGIIGTFSSSNYTISQGFIQPHYKTSRVNPVVVSLKAGVYPNPFTSIVHVEIYEPVKAVVEISLYDVSGRAILHKQFGAVNTLELYGDGLSPGFYMLKVFNNNKTYTTKLVKK